MDQKKLHGIIASCLRVLLTLAWVQTDDYLYHCLDGLLGMGLMVTYWEDLCGIIEGLDPALILGGVLVFVFGVTGMFTESRVYKVWTLVTGLTALCSYLGHIRV